MRGRLVIGLAALLLLAASGALASARAPVSGIVFAADQSPLRFGEIYRVGLDGSRVDLSRSIAHDTDPAVSPNGKLVAFVSNRTGRLAVYVVGIDGSGLRRVSPYFFSSDALQGNAQLGLIHWSRDGTKLAATLSAETTVAWAGDLHGHGHVIPPRLKYVVSLEWSPDGKELAATQTDVGEIDVRTPAGKLLWYASGDRAAWSAKGRLAVQRRDTVSVYDERGHRLAAFTAGAFAWSPNGSLLATQLGRQVQVRRGGLGGPVSSTVVLTPTQARNTGGGRNGSSGIEWLGSAKLRVDDGNGWVGLDVATGKPWTLPPAFAAFSYPPAAAADGKAVALVRPVFSPTRPSTLSVAALPGGQASAVTTAPPCPDDDAAPFAALQFTPGDRALVYQSGCPEPTADIYRVAPGAAAQRITSTVQHETDPVVSPDGTQIAYVRADSTDCRGCPTSIWLMNADGTNQRALTNAPDSTWDTDPSWSPDGKTILYWHSTIDTNGYLAEIPAAGGTAAKLPFSGIYPAWGPTRLAYEAPKLQQIRTAKPDGSAVRNLGKDVGLIPHSLAWSRDGRLAFLDQPQDGGALRLVVVSGTTFVRHSLGGLRPSPLGSGLAWSPDGTRLAFTATDDVGASDVWTVAPDGTHLERVTKGLGAAGGGLSWR